MSCSGEQYAWLPSYGMSSSTQALRWYTLTDGARPDRKCFCVQLLSCDQSTCKKRKVDFMSHHKLCWPYAYLLFCVITAQSATNPSLFQEITIFYVIPQCLPKPGVRERIFMKDLLKDLQVIHTSRLGIQSQRTREAKK